jgi:cytochrome c-type biogenesis protein CcmH
MMRWLFALLVGGTALFAGPTYAVRPDEMLADPGLEARAREVSRDLRCSWPATVMTR